MTIVGSRRSKESQWVPAIESKALSSAPARFNIRVGSQWLHWSGGMLTNDRKHGWIGSEAQGARAFQVFIPAAGGKLVEQGA